jgi:hypothetical protein
MDSNDPNLAQRKTPTQPMRPVVPTSVPVDAQASRGSVDSAPAKRGGCWLWAFAIAGFSLAVVSLILNGFLYIRLSHANEVTAEVFDEAITALDALPTQGFDIAIPISQTIEFSTTIPFKEEFNIPFQESITINRTVRVFVDAGILGKIPIDIPFYATIPIDITVPVQIDKEFAIQTEIPLEMVIPFRVEPEQFAVEGIIQTIRRWLTTLRELM